MRLVQQQEAPLCVNDAGDAANADGAATRRRFVNDAGDAAPLCVNDAGGAANAGGAATGGAALCE